MVGSPWKMRAKPCLVATFSSDEPGSVTAMKRWPALSAPIALRRRGEEIILHHVRLGGAAGLAGDDEQRSGDVDRCFPIARTCAGSVESSTCSFGKPGFLAQRFRQHFRPEARSAHAEHDRVGEILPLSRAAQILVVGDVGSRRALSASPAICPRRCRSRPICRAATAGGSCRRAPFLGAFFDGLADARRRAPASAVDAAGRARWRACAPPRHRACRRRRRTA
jgi:hypothetical protein